MEALPRAYLMSAQRKAEVEKTVRKERRKLFDFIRKRVKNEEDAGDILQDVFLQLASALEPIENMTAWLFRIARNRIIDSYRKKRPDRLEEVYGSSDESDTRLHWEELIPSGDSADARWMRETLWEEMMNALGELPEEQAEVFVKHELQDISFAEMAEQTGIPLPTLISRKRYAVQKLRERLIGVYEEWMSER